MNAKNRRIAEFYQRGQRYGIEVNDLDALRRIEMTLHRWSEHECNGNIQRDGDAGDGKPRWYYGESSYARGPLIADRERGALSRLAVVMAKYPSLIAYHQGDPRGCALYLVPKKDLPKGADISAYYSRGFAVCY